MAGCPLTFIAKLLAGATEAETLEEAIDELATTVIGGEAGLGRDGIVEQAVTIVVFAVTFFGLRGDLLIANRPCAALTDLDALFAIALAKAAWGGIVTRPL